MTERNWAGNLTYRARAIHRPRTVEQLQELVARTPGLRALGSRHSFSAIADADELVSLDDMPPAIEVDGAQVSLNPAVRYGELARELQRHDLALHNLASLPHISVGGAVATATHGSGERSGNLAAAVAALELVTGDGELLRARRGDPDFDGLAVGVGRLGVLARVTLDAEPFYEVRQHVYEGLAWEHVDDVFALGDSVSVFTRWGDECDQLWIKRRGDEAPPAEVFGARPATVERHPILGVDPVHCTAQLGVPGPWYERLPHFRMGFTPSAGNELQSEYHVARADGPAVLAALREVAPAFAALVQVTELRTIAADTLWLSPNFERDTLAIHFTWAPDPAGVDAALARIEPVLAPFAARPHWGKLHRADPAPLYPRWDDFAALEARCARA